MANEHGLRPHGDRRVLSTPDEQPGAGATAEAPGRRQSLQELEHSDWGEPTYDSELVKTCHRVRGKPIGDFSAEDLRILIGQQIGLPFLIPIALERLHRRPLMQGDYYRGDLLHSVLRVDASFWRDHPECTRRLGA